MHLLHLLITMGLAFILAYNAGRMSTMTDVDKIEGKKTTIWVYVIKYASVVLSFMCIVMVYGKGLARGVM